MRSVKVWGVLSVVVAAALGLVLSCGGGGGGSGSENPPAAVDPTTAGYAELGCGTDVFEEYASENNVKGKVLDIDAMNAAKLLVLNTSVQEGVIQRVSGTSTEQYAQSLGVTVGLEGSYMWFSASIQSSFTDHTYRMEEYSYVTLMERHFKNSLKVANTKWAPEYLKGYLTNDADLAINDTDPIKDWSPEDIIQTFGTHVMVGVFTGARLDYNLSIKCTDVSHETDIQAYAEMKAGTTFASATFSTSFNQSTYNEMSTYEQRENIQAKGGNEQYARPGSDEDYQLWKASIDENPCLVGLIKNALVPIWDLADDPARAASIQAYYAEYASGKDSAFLPLQPVIITGIEVTTGIPSTNMGYLPLKDASGSAAGAYVNKLVSSLRTPERQNDGIYPATQVWIAVKAMRSDQTMDPPVTGVHLYTGNSQSALDADMATYGAHSITTVDFNTDTCQEAVYWHHNPCPTSLCAYYCDEVGCQTANTNYRRLHYLASETTAPLKAIVLGDDTSKNTALDFATRKAHIWWGPQDLNNDGTVDDNDVQLVFSGLNWISDQNGNPINLNQGAQNYYVYDYECPWGCCWVATYIGGSPAQYLGYVSY